MTTEYNDIKNNFERLKASIANENFDDAVNEARTLDELLKLFIQNQELAVSYKEQLAFLLSEYEQMAPLLLETKSKVANSLRDFSVNSKKIQQYSKY